MTTSFMCQVKSFQTIFTMHTIWIAFVILSVIAVKADDNLIVLKNGDAEATVHLHGATIISWKVAGQEQLFVSEAAKLDGSTYIMGGVPIVFPKFADWGKERPFHGFARISQWDLVQNEGGAADFELKDNEMTRVYWNHTFVLKYSVVLEPKQIKSVLTVYNPSISSSSFNFETLFHTFIRVSDIKHITISGLQGLQYKDKTRNFTEFTETRNIVKIENFTDSIYKDAPNTILIANAVNEKTIELTKKGLPDLVVWNPWSEVIKTFTDLKPDEWKVYICAEAGHVINSINLPPGKEYEVSQTLSII